MVLKWVLRYSLFNLMEVLSIANNKGEMPINEQIRASQLMVIGPNGEQMGLKNLNDALTLANYAGLDLVLMSGDATPAVGKIMDYNRYRYERQKKVKEQQKKQRESNKDIKEYKLSVTIDIHDFNTRKNNAYDYLLKGHKVKASIMLKGREMAKPELGSKPGREVLYRFANELSEVSIIETEPRQEGRIIHMLLAPKK